MSTTLQRPASSAGPAGAAPQSSAQVMAAFQALLSKRPAAEGEARTCFHEHAFSLPSIKVLPGEYFVWGEGVLIQTVLGSCIAVCMVDTGAKLGGMNHFLLPDGGGSGGGSARYGVHAMEVLINGLLKAGCVRSRLVAKVFGGAAVIAGMSHMNVGARNVEFVDKFLQTERIPVRSRDVEGPHPRRVLLFPATGNVMVKRLPPTTVPDVREQEARAARQVKPAAQSAGSVELF